MLVSTQKRILQASLLGIALILSACSGMPEKQSDKIEMGVILPLSGEKSEYAQSVKRGMELAIEKINSDSASEKKLAILWFDTKGEKFIPQQTIHNLVKRDIKLIHAGFTPEIAYSLNSFGLLKDSTINYLCAYPPAAVHSANGLRIFLNGAQECEILAALAPQKNDEDNKLMIMGVNNALGKSCGDYLKYQTENARLKILADTFKDGEQNFDIFARQICLQKVGYLFMYGYGDTVQAALESLSKAGYGGMFAANSGFAEPLKNPAENIAFAQAALKFSLGTLTNKEHKDFIKTYEKKFGEKPHWTAAYGYDSIMLTWNALKKSGYNQSAAREFLLGKTFNGAIGEISIDKLGDSTSEMELLKNF